MSRMETLKTTVRNFHAQMVANAPPDHAAAVRLRAVLDQRQRRRAAPGRLGQHQWHYQSRELFSEKQPETTRSYDRNWIYKSGSVDAATVLSSYAATYHAGPPGYTYSMPTRRSITVPATAGSYSCDGSTPASTFTRENDKN